MIPKAPTRPRKRGNSSGNGVKRLLQRGKDIPEPKPPTACGAAFWYQPTLQYMKTESFPFRLSPAYSLYAVDRLESSPEAVLDGVRYQCGNLLGCVLRQGRDAVRVSIQGEGDRAVAEPA